RMRNRNANTRNGTSPSQPQPKRRTGRATGTPGVVSGTAVSVATPALALIGAYLTVAPTVVGQPLVMTSVALVIWSSVGRTVPVVSGSLACAAVSTVPALTIAS